MSIVSGMQLASLGAEEHNETWILSEVQKGRSWLLQKDCGVDIVD